MEHIWTVLCGSSTIDNDTNQLSLFNILEGIDITPPTNIPEDIKLEAIPLTISIISMIWRSDSELEEKGSLRIRVQSPDGKLVELDREPIIEINLTGKIRRFRSRARFQGMPYMGSGIYRFIIQIQSDSDSRWKTVSKVPLEINLVVDPEIPSEE